MLDGKLAIVTGGNRGIGRAVSLELHKNGARVIVVYRSRGEEANTICDYINKDGGEAYAYRCDVSRYSEVEKLVEEVVEKHGNVDILVNNAGISSMGMLIDMDEEQWDQVISSNLKSVFNMSKFVGKHMMWNKKGAIINMSSIWGDVGASCEVAYSASKGGINSFTRALAKELAPSGVRVNAISPGVISTEMNAWMSNDDKKELEEEIPLGRFGEAEEIGKMTVFLCCDKSSYVTGQVIRVDGGLI